MDNLSPWVVVGGCAAVVYVGLRLLGSLGLGGAGGKRVPGPKAYPLLGNLLDLAPSKGNLVPLFATWAKKYGPIMQFHVFGTTQVVVSDEAMVQELFSKRAAKYSGRGTPYAFEYASEGQAVALMPKNDAWRRQRKLVHSAISISGNSKYQAAMHTEAVHCIQHLLATPERFSDHFLTYSYGVIARCFYGMHIDSVSHGFVIENEEFIQRGMPAFDPATYPVNVFTFLRYFPTWMVPSMRKLEDLRTMMGSRTRNLQRDIERHRANSPPTDQPGIFSEFLANRSSYDISDFEANNAFFALIGGGTRSTHNSLLTFVYLMMAYPEWQTKLQAHIDDVVGPDRIPGWDDIPNLPLVRAVVCEGIRYRTIIAELGIPHQLDADDEYQGYRFKKGTIFHANYGAILSDPTKFPDAHPFNPARWIDPSYPTYREPLTTYPNCQAYAPFGYGRRACPGYDFAERSLVIAVACMAWAVDIKRPLGGDGEEYLPEITYEATPNPRPCEFGCRIVGREGRVVGS